MPTRSRAGTGDRIYQRAAHLVGAD